MGAEESERDINCVNWLFFKKRVQTHTQMQKKKQPTAASRPNGCVPAFNASNITFNRLTKTIYHAFTYTEQYKTG